MVSAISIHCSSTFNQIPFELDENRSHLLEADFVQTVVSLLDGYAASIPENRKEPMSLSIIDLKVVKTAFGVILNASVGYGESSSEMLPLNPHRSRTNRACQAPSDIS